MSSQDKQRLAELGRRYLEAEKTVAKIAAEIHDELARLNVKEVTVDDMFFIRAIGSAWVQAGGDVLPTHAIMESTS